MIENIDNLDGVLYKKNVNLKKYNTYKVKAKARHFFMPKDTDSFSSLLMAFKEKNIKYTILGGGSNILFLDDVVKTPIIYTGFFSRIGVVPNGIKVYSGLSIKETVKYAYKNSFGGLEFLYGLPGTVGGASYMNAKCYGHSISDFISKIGIIDETGEYRRINNDECEYSYKKSIFQNKDYTIIDIVFALKEGSRKEIKKLMKESFNDRKKKHQYKYPSAGCVFLNDYSTNTVAGSVIESLGLKGHSIGGAVVSSHHANFIVNKGGASGDDIYNLIKYVQTKVYEETGIKLLHEVRIIGEISGE